MIVLRKKRLAVCIVGFLIVSAACLSLFFVHSNQNVKHSSQSDYPTLGEYQGLVSVLQPAGLDVLASMSDAIVEGEVMEVLPVKETVLDPESGTAEAAILEKTGAGMNFGIVKSYPVSIRVIDTMKGTVPQEIVLYRSELTIDGEPVLKAGDTLIFFLHSKTSSAKDFVITSHNNGYFYVAGDRKVYPADLTEGFKKYSGASLDSFKKDIAVYLSDK